MRLAFYEHLSTFPKSGQIEPLRLNLACWRLLGDAEAVFLLTSVQINNWPDREPR